jgi:uncharacterized protein YjiK
VKSAAIRKYICLCIYAIVCSQCRSQNSDDIYTNYDKTIVPFDIFQPTASHELPEVLDEISGLTYFENNMLAAVEDEHGRIYFLDGTDGSLVREIRFEGRGDFEAIEFYDGIFWVLKSNGDLYSVTVGEEVSSKKYDTGLKRNNDTEGLTVYRGRHVIACKNEASAGDNDLKGKALYFLNKSQHIAEGDYWLIRKNDLEDLIRQRIPELKINAFDPSGISVDPISGMIYVISADHIMAVLNPDGSLAEVVLLDRKLYRQPEGICFTPSGDLYISSEADGKKPLLFRLERI